MPRRPAGIAGLLLLLLLVAPVAPVTPAPPATGSLRVLLLDRSASMQHPEMWEEACRRVDALIADVGPERRAALVAFDAEARVEVPLTTNPELLRAALWQVIRPGGPSTSPRAGLAAARALFAEEGRSGEIHLVSDFQASIFAGWRPEPGEGNRLVPHPVAVPAGANHSVGPVRLRDGRLELEVRRSGRAPVPVRLPPEAGVREGALRVRGEHPELRVTTVRLAEGVRGVVVDLLSGDGWPFDDRRLWLEAGGSAVAGQPLPAPPPGLRGVLGPAGDRWGGGGPPRGHRPTPGLYRLEGAEGVAYLVVHPDPREGRLAPVRDPRGAYSAGLSIH